MSAAWPYPAAPGVREAIHARFVGIIERATAKATLPARVWLEDLDDVAQETAEADGGSQGEEVLGA